MTGPGAKRVVVGSMAATAALSASRDLSGGRAPRLRIFFGVIGAGVFLALLAEGAPDLAGMLALVMLSTAVFTAGASTFAAIGRAIQR